MSSGTPYIGSKISLISKAKIRYEGFLYTIDQQDSTVTLAKVRSLGTEDRVPNDPVPAREEIFEYIVFRGHDIEDLNVSECPTTVDDPAIVHNGPIQSTQSFQSRNVPFQPPTYAPFGGGMPTFGYPYPKTTHEQHSNRQPTPPNLPRTPTPTDSFKQPVNKDDRSQSNNQSKIENSKNNERKDSYGNRNKENTDRKSFYDNRYRERRDNKDKDNKNTRKEMSDRREYKEKDNRDRDQRRDNRYNNRDGSSNYRKEEKDKNDRNSQNERNSQNDRRRGQSRGRGNRGGSKNTRGGGGGSNREKFTEDFDFETANAKFHKEEIEQELLKNLNKIKIPDDEDIPVKSTQEVDEKDQDDLDPLPSPDKFYDRSKSFFDNISCEAMGPKAKPAPADDAVMTRRQERALNVETFGTTGGYYRRGGYRGGRGYSRGRGRGRGRGGWRGRGGNRSNSNQNWVDYEFDYEAAGIKSQNMKSSVPGS